MNYQDVSTIEKSDTLINKRFLYIFLSCLILSHFLHELGHYFATIIQGGQFRIYYLSWSVITPLSDVNILIIEFTGPIITLILAYLGIFLIKKTQNYKLFGISFAFINSMMKLIDYIPNILNISSGGDEYWIAQILHINKIIIYIIFLLAFLPPLFYVLFRICKDYSQQVKIIIIITVLFCIYVGLSVLLDRVIIFNSEIFEFISMFGLSIPFLIIGIISVITFIMLSYQNITQIP